MSDSQVSGGYWSSCCSDFHKVHMSYVGLEGQYVDMVRRGDALGPCGGMGQRWARRRLR
jgi:hypothetical protein